MATRIGNIVVLVEEAKQSCGECAQALDETARRAGNGKIKYKPMGLLDFDDTFTPRFRPKTDDSRRDNFEELQNLGHKKVSEDYSDEIEKL